MIAPIRRAFALTRRPAVLLFIFLCSIYLLTMGANRGGYGYSPDGTFAFEMAKSMVLDPGHAYLRMQYRNFSRWGVGTPVLLVPFLAFADPLSDLAPQRDRLTVDGHQYLLSTFDSVGHAAIAGARQSVRFDVPQRVISEFNLVSHLGLSVDIPNGTEVASIRITDFDGRIVALPIRAGIETAEWAYERADVKRLIQHDRGRVVGAHIGNTRASYYFARYRFAEPIAARSAELVYTGPAGIFFMDSGAVRDAATGEMIDVPGQGRVWSERQNKEFFLRFWAPVLNVLLTAATALLVYATVKTLRYGDGPALALGLAYGLGTMAWPYAKYDFTEPAVAFFLAGAVLSTLHYGKDLRLRFALVAGLLALAAFLTKYASAVALPVLVAQIVLMHKAAGAAWTELPKRAWRGVVVFSVPLALVVLPALLALGLLLDFRILYEQELIGGIQRGWLGVPLWLGIRGLLFSWGKSLFLYNPVLIVALPATIWFVRRHGWRSFMFVAIPAFYVLLYAKKEVWYGGNSWGPRYLLPAVPFLMVMCAPVFAWAGERSRRWAKAGLAVIFALSIVPQALGVAKDFDQYLSIYADQVAWQLPEQGAFYGGREYQKWSSIQPEGDLAAVLFAPQFTPLLGHIWLLRADAVEMLLPDRLDLIQDAQGRTPWSRFGIQAAPARPQDGAGIDFWSLILWASYLNHKSLVAIVMGSVLILELVALASLGMLLRTSAVARSLPRWLRTVAVAGFAMAALAFDTLHFML